MIPSHRLPRLFLFPSIPSLAIPTHLFIMFFFHLLASHPNSRLNASIQQCSPPLVPWPRSDIAFDTSRIFYLLLQCLISPGLWERLRCQMRPLGRRVHLLHQSASQSFISTWLAAFRPPLHEAPPPVLSPDSLAHVRAAPGVFISSYHPCYITVSVNSFRRLKYQCFYTIVNYVKASSHSSQ
uniref:Uncharacterized protein n=1 Tax=Arundo donax TaxID=35708 RepID=A0A0A8Z4M8_ARUDO